MLQGKKITVENQGGYLELNAPYDYIPLHIRGGQIIPVQEHANTTYFRSVKD